MPCYPFECQECETQFDIVLSIKEYDEQETWGCLNCESKVSKKDRIILASSVLRASYAMGTKRAGFADLKETLKLKTESYNMKPKERDQIKKTIKEIKDRGKDK
tara:strand:+ start:13484 stop:13795 length:312 start_codon:yes stop_codon:yes gene_type:complete